MSISTIINIQLRTLFVLIFIIATGSLALAFFTEFVLGFPPCKLCLYQRWPYLALMIASFAALTLKKYDKLFLLLIIVSILSSIGIAAYHTAIERGWLDGTTKCNPDINMPDNLSAAEIRNQLYIREVASCTKPPFKVMMLSMTEWNLLFNVALLAYLSFYIRKRIYA